jgi:hypothetical protein
MALHTEHGMGFGFITMCPNSASMGKRTSVQLQEETRKRLAELKPFSSMSYDDLLNDMADVYESEVGG